MFNKSCFNKTLYNRGVSFYIAIIYSTEIKAGILNDCIYSIENKIGITLDNNYLIKNTIGVDITKQYNTRNETGIINYLVCNTDNKIGIEFAKNFPSSNIIGTELLKTYQTESVIGFNTLSQYNTTNNIGIKKIHIIPTNNYILLNDISFVRSHYGKAIKLGNKILELNTNITEDYTVRILRYEWDNKYVDIVIRSDGKVFVNGRENQYYDISWFIANDGSFIIHPEANAIDEICIIPEIIDDSEIKKWYDREVYFYDREQNIVNIPKEVDIEII